MKLEIKCTGADIIKVEDLLDFQGDLKTLSDDNYQKFKAELLELGFSEPISVWKNPEGKNYILNGHQRRKTILSMIEEGIEVPKLPINFVEADDIKQAKRKVLALTSQYGQMTEAGLEDFCAKAELDVNEALADFRFPEIEGFDIDEIELPEMDDGEKEPFRQITFTLHDSQADLIDECMRLINNEAKVYEEINENRNGNAITYIVKAWKDGIS